LEYYKNEIKEQKGRKKVSRNFLPTCFERASEAGGVWRAQRTFVAHPSNATTIKLKVTIQREMNQDGREEKKRKSTMESKKTTATNAALQTDFTDSNMFEAFLDHFGCALPLPAFLPRQKVLDYLLARVTRNCPTFLSRLCSIPYGGNSGSIRYGSITI